MTHFSIEAFYTRIGGLHEQSVTLRHVRHDRCFGDGSHPFP
jgi:hypothetical protein